MAIKSDILSNNDTCSFYGRSSSSFIVLVSVVLHASQETKFVMNGCESEVRVGVFVCVCVCLTVSECMWERGRCMYACVGVGGEREGYWYATHKGMFQCLGGYGT